MIDPIKNPSQGLDTLWGSNIDQEENGEEISIEKGGGGKLSRHQGKVPHREGKRTMKKRMKNFALLLRTNGVSGGVLC